MKDLNLDKNYPLFDWNATEDRKASYKALIEKQNTANFKMSVWNELVDIVNDVLTRMGYSWNDTYASYANTKIHKILFLFPGVLYATKFNSLVYNLSCIVENTWIWHYDKNYEGYIGRFSVRGALQTNEPDTVYASMILELVRKLNLFINTLKDEADILNQVATLKEQLISDVTLAIPKIQEVNIKYTSSSLFDSNLIIDEPYLLKINDIFKASSNSNVSLKNAANTMKSTVKLKSYAKATLEIEELYRNLYSKLLCQMKFNARLEIDFNECKLKINIPAALVENANLTLPELSKIIADSAYGISTDSKLSFVSSKSILVDDISKLIAESILSCSDKKIFSTKLVANSKYSIKAEMIKGSTFYSVVASITKYKANIKTGHSARAYSTVSCNLNISIPQMVGCIAKIMKPEAIEAVAEITDLMSKGISGPLASILSSQDDISSDMVKGIVINTDSMVDGISTQSGELEAMAIRLCRYSEDIVSDISGSINTLICSIMGSDINSEMATNIKLDIHTTKGSIIATLDLSGMIEAGMITLNYGDNYLKARTGMNVSHNLNLGYVEPYLLEIKDNFTEQSDALLKVVDSSQTLKINCELFKEIYSDKLSIVVPSAFETATQSDAFFNAEMSFDPSSWLNPVQIDDDLQVYQTYEAEQTEDNLLLK